MTTNKIYTILTMIENKLGAKVSYEDYKTIEKILKKYSANDGKEE